jgi:hypothetical protein
VLVLALPIHAGRSEARLEEELLNLRQ